MSGHCVGDRSWEAFSQEGVNIVKEQEDFLFVHHLPCSTPPSKLFGLMIRLCCYQRPNKGKKEMAVPDSAILSLSMGISHL